MFIIEKDFHGKKLTIETGRIAKQANGAAFVTCGDSVVLVTACRAPGRTDAGFLALTVDYVEKTYAAGKIPGGYFRREAKLSDRETLVSRLIDRPCRPLFPEGYSDEIQVLATVMSADPEVPTDMLAVLGASAALTVSDIPFEGPIAGVRVCRNNGKLLINPSHEVLEKSELHFIVAGSKDAIVMVEGGAQIVPEAEVLDALFYAHQEMQVLIEMQNELRAKCGKEKIKVEPVKLGEETIVKKARDFIDSRVKEVVSIREKQVRGDAISKMKKDCILALAPEGSTDELKAEATKVTGKVAEDVLYNSVREMAIKQKIRLDGRDSKTVRPISIECGILPRTHGSALFTRGETQSIVTATLGIGDDAQEIEALTRNYKKRFMLHYNFPAYSTGEVKPNRGPGRREIGHGVLAERSIQVVLPDEKASPYVIRIVSEITESNGSSSMATVCGGTLALMDAGIKIKAPVAGVAMGLIKEGSDFVVLTDILGDEDHLGDMDFKVCGTEAGITGLQMDIKIKGLDKQIMSQALEQARDARLHILGKMNEAISAPRTQMNPYAPRIEVIKISTNKIRDVIGSGGKVIKSLIEEYQISIDVQDDGTVTVAGMNRELMDAGIKVIKALTAEAEVGKIYQGIVKRIAAFGAFVEILPGTDGLLHVSEIAESHVRNVQDVLSEGDQVPVKVLEVDTNGKIRLSRKSAMKELGLPL
jgi:polyribonucleotide nucleotidyltransferase